MMALVHATTIQHHKEAVMEENKFEEFVKETAALADNLKKGDLPVIDSEAKTETKKRKAKED